MIKKTITVELETGLEARPVALLVQLASQYKSNIHMECADKKVNAKSIMGMMTLALPQGEQINIIADGSDEEAAVSAIENYLMGSK